MPEIPFNKFKAIKNRLGLRYGRLLVIEFAFQDGRGTAHWKCRCDCGNEKVVSGGPLTTGVTQSCGCLHRERSAISNLQHGGASKYNRAPEYYVWMGIKTRCFNTRNKAYENYGGRGITMCAAWRKNFPQFVADIGPRPGPEFTLDRIDNNGNYEPGNCCWALNIDQQNNRRATFKITVGDETMSVSQWARRLSVTEETIRYRVWKTKAPVAVIEELIATKAARPSPSNFDL